MSNPLSFEYFTASKGSTFTFLQIYCFLRKKCVGLNGVPTPESCANGSGTDDSGDWGDHGGWNGDWDMGGGDDGQCHGDSCTVCDEGQVGFF